MIFKEFMAEYRESYRPGVAHRNSVGGKPSVPTTLETLLFEAGNELERLRGVLTERTLAVRDAAVKLGGKLLKDSIDEIVLNTCGELQVAPACDHAVMEFMSQRDHVQTLMKAVEMERQAKA